MEIKTKFELDNAVTITPLEIKGRVVDYVFDRRGLLVGVRYFINGEPNYDKFLEDELTLLENPQFGFMRNDL